MRDRLDRFAAVCVDSFRAADAELLRWVVATAADFAAGLDAIGRVVLRLFRRRA